MYYICVISVKLAISGAKQYARPTPRPRPIFGQH